MQDRSSFNTIGKQGQPLLMLAKWYQDWSDPALGSSSDSQISNRFVCILD
jgi:hypothetical protein